MDFPFLSTLFLAFKRGPELDISSSAVKEVFRLRSFGTSRSFDRPTTWVSRPTVYAMGIQEKPLSFKLGMEEIEEIRKKETRLNIPIASHVWLINTEDFSFSSQGKKKKKDSSLCKMSITSLYIVGAIEGSIRNMEGRISRMAKVNLKKSGPHFLCIWPELAVVRLFFRRRSNSNFHVWWFQREERTKMSRFIQR